MVSKNQICILGLGYVGLPLSIEFAKKYKTISFDVNSQRIKDLKRGFDKNKEISKDQLLDSKIKFTNDVSEISGSNYYIVAVPTPINSKKKPKLNNLKNACTTISKVLKKNDIVVFESTVYPGLTEEYCVPLLEKNNKLKLNKDFFCGYSPERINPGDKINNIKNIIKITSGSNKYSANKIDKLYKSIIKAGTYKAESIKVAEAAKVIENTQRDLNIAFVNELSKIFNKMQIDTEDVLNAASTKWNFLNFKPGLVGGHCIGVDPYYLTHKSKKLNYNPKVILSGRKINDSMPNYIVEKLITILLNNFTSKNGKKILILGYTFKENCSDYRNSKVANIVNKIIKNKMIPYIYDPNINIRNIKNRHNKLFVKKPKNNFYDAIIIAVAHKEIKQMGINKINSYSKRNKIIIDLKGVFPKKYSIFRL